MMQNSSNIPDHGRIGYICIPSAGRVYICTSNARNNNWVIETTKKYDLAILLKAHD